MFALSLSIAYAQQYIKTAAKRRHSALSPGVPSFIPGVTVLNRSFCSKTQHTRTRVAHRRAQYRERERERVMSTARKKSSTTTAQRNRALFVRPVTCELSHTLSTPRVHLCVCACTRHARTHVSIYIMARVTRKEASLAPTASGSLIIGTEENNRIEG